MLNATAAKADDLISLFENICLSTHADQAAAIAKARQMNFSDQELVQKRMQNVEYSALLYRSDAKGEYIVQLGHYENGDWDKILGTHLNGAMCAVASGIPPNNFEDRVSALVGRKGDHLDPSKSYYFREIEGLPTPVDPSTADPNIVKTGPVFGIIFGQNPKVTHVTLMVESTAGR
jgi:hypothetical protein